MNNTLIIPIHSMVDLITNSSSEIFIEATAKTIAAIKKLVSDLLAVGATSSTAPVLSADDLFDFDLVKQCYDDKYNDVFLTDKEIKAKKKELKKLGADGDDGDSSFIGGWEFPDDDTDPVTNVRVKVKEPFKDDKRVAAVAKVLSNLTGIFNIETSYQ